MRLPAHIPQGFPHGNWLYVAGSPGTGRVKIGITNDTYFRMGSLKKQNGGIRPIVFFKTWVNYNAYRLEKTVHSLLRREALGKEWFACSPAKAALAARRARQFCILIRSAKSRGWTNHRSNLELDELRREYDLRAGLVGKHFMRMRE